jgi:protein arginine kinase activator
MNCENCGKEEVSFHYTSNINGSITEKHLCAECAVRLGYNKKLGFSAEDGSGGGLPGESEKSFEEAFAELFGFTPNRRMFRGYGMVIPTFIIPTVGVLVPGGGSNPAAGVKQEERSEASPAVDKEMKRRREINILRERMRVAAEAEEYEKAAELRDAIKKLEIGAD